MPRKLTLFLMVALALAGCRGKISDKPPIHPNPNMDDQERYDPQEASVLFPDNRAMRLPVPGTIARGELRTETVFYQGQYDNGDWVQFSPVTTTAEMLARGQKQYDIYCAVCHDRVGTGRGIVSNYPGMTPPTNLHDERIRLMPDGQIFNAITFGIRTMPSYRHQIRSEEDRWAIVAYLRALQRSQSTTLDDVPRDMIDNLETRPNP